MFVCVYRAHARENRFPHTYHTKTQKSPRKGLSVQMRGGLVLGLVLVLLRQFFEHPLDAVEPLPVRGVVLEEPKEREECVEGYAPPDDRADKFPAHFAPLLTLM